MRFRDYQINIIQKGTRVIKEHGFVYLAMEVRTGKTLTSFGIAQNLSAISVLFVTKKKAISSIHADYDLLSQKFKINITNYESLHKVLQHPKLYDLIILDEAHSLGAIPKPNKRAKQAPKHKTLLKHVFVLDNKRESIVLRVKSI